MKIGYTCLTLCVGTLLSCPAFAGEKRTTFDKLPTAVQRTAKSESNGFTVRGYTTETDHGKTTYEVEMTKNGKSKDVSLDESGKVVEVEQQIALDQVPTKAKAALQSQAASGRITKVETVTGSGPTVYEAQVKAGAKHSEVRVNENGELAPED